MRRNHSVIDNLIGHADHMLRTLNDVLPDTGKPVPTHNRSVENTKSGERDDLLSDIEKRQSAALMRVNHAGEVAAQALYHGQSVVARDETFRASLKQAQLEEGDHLRWCKHRVEQLGDRTSILDPCWYFGAFSIGVAVALLGDKWSRGFLAETENQVVQHLQRHLDRLPDTDVESRAILEQMCEDEAMHQHQAEQAGMHQLPPPAKGVMKLSSKVMTTLSYWI